MNDLEQKVRDHIDIRLARRRPSGVELVVALRFANGRQVVQLATVSGEQNLARVTLAAEELDDVIRALGECRRVTLGAPQESSAHADVKALSKASKRRG